MCQVDGLPCGLLDLSREEAQIGRLLLELRWEGMLKIGEKAFLRDAEPIPSNKEGVEGVEAPGDDTCPTSRESSDLGIEGSGRATLDMW